MVAPVPLAVSEIELELLVKKEILAEAVAAAVGAKVTVKGTICPAAIVTGKASPLSVNWELLELADERVTLDRKSTRLNSSHPSISYAVFWLKIKERRDGVRCRTHERLCPKSCGRRRSSRR